MTYAFKRKHPTSSRRWGDSGVGCWGGRGGGGGRRGEEPPRIRLPPRQKPPLWRRNETHKWLQVLSHWRRINKNTRVEISRNYSDEINSDSHVITTRRSIYDLNITADFIRMSPIKGAWFDPPPNADH